MLCRKRDSQIDLERSRLFSQFWRDVERRDSVVCLSPPLDYWMDGKKKKERGKKKKTDTRLLSIPFNILYQICWYPLLIRANENWWKEDDSRLLPPIHIQSWKKRIKRYDRRIKTNHNNNMMENDYITNTPTVSTQQEVLKCQNSFDKTWQNVVVEEKGVFGMIANDDPGVFDRKSMTPWIFHLLLFIFTQNMMVDWKISFL